MLEENMRKSFLRLKYQNKRGISFLTRDSLTFEFYIYFLEDSQDFSIKHLQQECYLGFFIIGNVRIL